MSDVQSIVAGLTKAQKQCVVRGSAKSPTAVRNLAKLGLGGGWVQLGKGTEYLFSLSPLGLKVRDALTNSEGSGE